MAKLLAGAAKNFKNVSKTVAVRQQLRSASVFFEGIFSQKVILPIRTRRKLDLLGDNSPNMVSAVEFMDDQSLLCQEVVKEGQLYKVDDVVILRALAPDHLEVGLVLAIIVKQDKVVLMVTKYQAHRNKNNLVFETFDFERRPAFVKVENLCDYKPLHKHGVYEKFLFCLHHSVPLDTSFFT